MEKRKIEYNQKVKKIERKQLILELATIRELCCEADLETPNVSNLKKSTSFLVDIVQNITNILRNKHSELYICECDAIKYSEWSVNFCNYFLEIDPFPILNKNGDLCVALKELENIIKVHEPQHLNVLECAFLSMPLTWICVKLSNQILFFEENMSYDFLPGFLDYTRSVPSIGIDVKGSVN